MDQDIINRHYDNVLIKILDREDSSPILIWCHVFDTSFDSCLQMHHSCRLKQLVANATYRTKIYQPASFLTCRRPIFWDMQSTQLLSLLTRIHKNEVINFKKCKKMFMMYPLFFNKTINGIIINIFLDFWKTWLPFSIN